MTTNNNSTERKVKANTSFLARKCVPQDSKEKFKWISISSNDLLDAIEPVPLNKKVLKNWYDATSQGFDYANIEPYKDYFSFGIGKGKAGKTYCQKGCLYLLFDKSVSIYNRMNNTTLLCAEGNTDALMLISAGVDKKYGVLKRENLQSVPKLDDIPSYIKKIIFFRDSDESYEELKGKLLKKGYKKMVAAGIELYTIGYEEHKKKDISECLYSSFEDNFERNIDIISELIILKIKPIINIPIKDIIKMDYMIIKNRVPSVVVSRIINTFFKWKYNTVTLEIQIQLNKKKWDIYIIPDKEQWNRTFKEESTTFDNNYANALDRFVKQMVERYIGKAISLNDNSIKILTTPDSDKNINPFSDYFDNLKIIAPSLEYNPLRDALNCLTFHKDIEEHREKIVELVGKWLGMAIRCANGEQVNEIMIILTGDQGAGKSTFFNSLIPDTLKDYVTDTIEENKDGSQSLTDSFLAIDDELDGMKRNNLEKLKKRITASKFKFRPPYGAKSVNKIRRASFLGATNTDDFLVDSTGNRRFFCISVIKNKNIETHTANMKKLRELDTDLLWSVGKYYAKQSDSIFYKTEEIQFINDNLNKAFEEENIYDQLVKSHIKNPNECTEKDNMEFMTPANIIARIDRRCDTKLSSDRYSSNNIGKALKKANFKRTTKYDNRTKYSVKGYEVSFVE